MPKPTVFLSHIHEDHEIASALESIIRDALLSAFDIFNSSNRTSLNAGDPWRDVIIDRLRNAAAVLVIATPESVGSSWINFESGGAWLAERRVIPCCGRGMTPSSLPAPLSHLQAIDLARSEDLQGLIDNLAKAVNLDAPKNFDYSQAAKSLVSAWNVALTRGSNTTFLAELRKMKARPKLYVGESCRGVAVISNIYSVTPFESKQFPSEHLVPGDSIRCWITPQGPDISTLYQCYAKGESADLISHLPDKTLAEVVLKCLGQMKVYEFDIPDFDNEDRGVSYPEAFLIETVQELRR